MNPSNGDLRSSSTISSDSSATSVSLEQQLNLRSNSYGNSDQNGDQHVDQHGDQNGGDGNGDIRATASADEENDNPSSVTRILSALQSVPTNRCCAECRIALVDPSQVFLSYCLPSKSVEGTAMQHTATAARIYDFHRNHKAFAPPNRQATNDSIEVSDATPAKNIDPAFHLNERMGGHCVFVCRACSQAHDALGSAVTTMYAVQDAMAPWTPHLVAFFEECGGNARSWEVYERYISQSWKAKRPTPASELVDRVLFCRAKYEALAFAFPPTGPLAQPIWSKILHREPEIKPYVSKNLIKLRQFNLNAGIDAKSSSRRSVRRNTGALPNRLVDYFCVVKPTMKLSPGPTNSKATSVDELAFVPHIETCFPSKTAHSDMEFPDHLATFVLPEGCKPTTQQLPPRFFSIVLTNSDGQRMYGCVLQIYDEPTDMHTLKKQVQKSYADDAKKKIQTKKEIQQLPECITNPTKLNDVVFFAKCLVVLSHYPFQNKFRSVLLRLYRLTLVEAPLPIERYISNFVSEVPLPPRGRIRVEFGFDVDKLFTIERPPPNQLPMADISFRPLFASLSAGNIITVIGCLMQECRVALFSSHVSMLCPVAQALLTVMFPFTWQGMYVPVLPDSMYDVLDAPVPFLVGLGSKYLHQTPASYRPKGVVLVDLDKDVIHMGYNEERDGLTPRMPPALPYQDALKLRNALEENGGNVYILPNSGLKGCIMTGGSILLQNKDREVYARMSTVEVTGDLIGRKEIFSATDRAYSNDDLNMTINMVAHGQFTDDTRSVNSSNSDKEGAKKGKGGNRHSTFMGMRSPFKRLQGKKNSMEDFADACLQGHLLDQAEPEGFSSTAIRNAFVRFFVTIFNGYRYFLSKDSGNDLFKEESFLEEQGMIPKKTLAFLQAVLETQMFQTFLEERAKNPSQPEVKYFDESILAKNNRSKMFVLRNGGRKLATPFLDSQEAKITKTYIAPRASDVGLPPHEGLYHYGVFPKLDKALVGKPRPAMTWKQHQGESFRNRLTQTKKVLETQQQLVRKAIKPLVIAQLAISNMARKSIKDLDSALLALAPMTMNSALVPMNLVNPAESKNAAAVASVKKWKANRKNSDSDRRSSSSRNDNGSLSKKNIDSSTRSERSDVSKASTSSRKNELVMIVPNIKRSKAETLLLDARRKQATLLILITKIQRCFRRYMVAKQRRLNELPQQPAPTDDREEQSKIIAKKQRRRRSSVAIQNSIRSFLARQNAQRRKAAIGRLQRCMRGMLVRKHLWRQRNAAVRLQAIVRGRRMRFIFTVLRNIICKQQARIRGYFVRKKLRDIIQRRLDLYRTQVFGLWSVTSTSLAFRTKFWPCLHTDRPFLTTAVAESELLRLWTTLRVGIEPNEQAIFDHELVTNALGGGVQIRDTVYRRALDVHPLLEKAVEGEENAGQVFPKYRGDSAARFEAAERVQIYERLNADSMESKLPTLFKRFSIDPKGSLKKDRLARTIWQHMAQSQDSSMTMSELFPELDTQVAIRFQKAGNKTQRRFSDAKKWKECQSSWTMALWEESSLEGRIKGNVRQVALSMVSRSPNDKQHLEASMKKLEADQRLQKQKRAFMEAHHCSTWDECQTMLLKLYVLPAEEREESMREAALHSTRNATPTAREVKPQRSSNPFD